MTATARDAMWLVLLACAAACGDKPAAAVDAGVESRLCTRLERCDLLPDDSDGAGCLDVLDGCTRDFDAGVRADWQHAINACLADDACDALESCYLNAPGC